MRRLQLVAVSLASSSLALAADGDLAPIPNRSDLSGAMSACARSVEPVRFLACVGNNLKFLRKWQERDTLDTAWHEAATDLAIAVSQQAEFLLPKEKDRPYLATVGIATYGVPKETKLLEPHKHKLCGAAEAALMQACRLQMCGQVTDQYRVRAFVNTYEHHCRTAPPTCNQPLHEACKAAYDQLDKAVETYASRLFNVEFLPPAAQVDGKAALEMLRAALVEQKLSIDQGLQQDTVSFDAQDALFIQKVVPAEWTAIKTVDSAIVRQLKLALPKNEASTYTPILKGYEDALRKTGEPSSWVQYDGLKQRLAPFQATTGALFGEYKEQVEDLK